MFQPNHERPGSRPRARVVHRDRPVDVGWADAREALGQLHIRRILLAAVGIQTYLKTYEFGFSTFEKHSRLCTALHPRGPLQEPTWPKQANFEALSRRRSRRKLELLHAENPLRQVSD